MPEFWWLVLCLSGLLPRSSEVEEQLRAENQELKEKLAEGERCLEKTARDLTNLRYV